MYAWFVCFLQFQILSPDCHVLSDMFGLSCSLSLCCINTRELLSFKLHFMLERIKQVWLAHVFFKKICFLKPALKQSWALCLIQALGKAPRVSWKATPGYLQPLECLNTLLGDWWVLLTLVWRWKRRNKVTQRIKRKSMSAPGLEFTLAWFLSPGTSSPMDPSFVSLWVRRGQGVSTRGKTSAILRAWPCRKALPFNKLQSREVTWRWFILISSLYKWEKGHKNARTSKNARPAVTQ